MEAAKARGFKVFALQDGGQCFGSDDLNAYKKYGGSTQCSDGTGGPFANSVYEIREGKGLVIFYKTNDYNVYQCLHNNLRNMVIISYDVT